MGVEENERADEVAKETAERPGTRRCPERFTSLVYVGLMILERKWKQAKHWFRVENDRQHPLQRAGYNPALGSQDMP